MFYVRIAVEAALAAVVVMMIGAFNVPPALCALAGVLLFVWLVWAVARVVRRVTMRAAAQPR